MERNFEDKEESLEGHQSFFLENGRQRSSKHNQLDKFRSSNQQVETSEGLTSNKNKEFQKALGKGNCISKKIFPKLNNSQKTKLKQAVKEKKDNGNSTDGSLGMHYTTNNQISSQSSGTNLVPM